MVGAGFMGRGLANHIVNSVPGMDLVAIVNRSPDRASSVYALAGKNDASILSGPRAVGDGIRSRVPVVCENASDVLETGEVDCLIDVTGAVEYGASVTLEAIEAGVPMVTMNAELDATVGPALARRARAANVVFTGCDGDQPGVLMNLIRFVRGIGCVPLVAGNIKGLQDPYRTPSTQEAYAEKWGQNVRMVTSFADGTKISFEQAVIANAAGFTVPKRGMNGWNHNGHIDELTSRYDINELRALGGIVDYVVGSQPSPGVFVLATHDDAAQRRYLELYKLGPGPLYSFYTPYHLCHLEVPNSVVRAVDFGDSTVTSLGSPRVEVLTVAKRDLPAGTELDGLGGYDTYGQAESAETTRTDRLLPMGLSEGCVLRRRIGRDEVVSYDDVTVPPDRVVDRLREEQQP
jgi:predicted homoserine dehydrogenase-like protein